jgi:hypothetical protein
LEQLEKARQAREAKRIAAFGRLLKSLPSDEVMAVEAMLEANLVNQPVPPAIQQRATRAFTKAWAAAAPEDRALLTNDTMAEAW